MTNTKFKCIDLPVSITEKQTQTNKKNRLFKKSYWQTNFGNRKEEKTHKLLKEKVKEKKKFK